MNVAPSISMAIFCWGYARSNLYLRCGWNLNCGVGGGRLFEMI